MALTFSLVKDGVLGDLNYKITNVTFDTSYPTGGESLTPEHFGWNNMVELKARGTLAGYDLSYDYTNEKLKVFRVAPGLIVEESVTVASNVGTLKNIPAYIVAVSRSTTQACHVIPVGKTPLTNQVAVNFTTGGLTFVAADAVTTAKVTYFPVKEGTIFASPTIDEAVVASASKVNLAARAAMVQYVYDSTDGVMDVIIPSGEAPGATHEASVDINDSSNTSVDTNVADDGNTLLVTYIPYANLPDVSMFIDDTDISSTFEPYNFTQTAHYNGLVVPGLGTHFVGEDVGTLVNRDLPLAGPSVTPTDGTAVAWSPALNTITAAQTTNLTTVSIPWIILSLGQTQSGLMEVPSATDLSSLIVRVYALGW